MFVKELLGEKNVFCTEEMPLTGVYEIMSENGCDFVPVVESRAHCIPIGAITEHDICYQILGRGRNPRDMTAANVMNSHIVKIEALTDIEECLQMMNAKKARCAVVIDENGRLCGTLSHREIEKSRNKKTTQSYFSGTRIHDYTAPGINRIF